MGNLTPEEKAQLMKEMQEAIRKFGLEEVVKRQKIEKDLVERFYKGEPLTDEEYIYFYEMWDDDVLYDDDYKETGDFALERDLLGDETASKLERDMQIASGVDPLAVKNNSPELQDESEEQGVGEEDDEFGDADLDFDSDNFDYDVYDDLMDDEIGEDDLMTEDMGEEDLDSFEADDELDDEMWSMDENDDEFTLEDEDDTEDEDIDIPLDSDEAEDDIDFFSDNGSEDELADDESDDWDF